MSEPRADVEAMRAAERRGEDAYDRMYDAHNYRVAKDCYDDAREGLYRAMRIAEALGLTADRERLSQRVDHVIAVWSHQFRQ